MAPKFEIRDFQFYYGQKQVIFDLDLDIAKNEIISVLGPANSGVTSLLRSLNRLCDINPETRASGDVLLDGKNIRDPDVSVTELRRKVGMVFDVPTPLPMSIRDNITFGPRLGGRKGKRVLDETVEQALRMAALWDDVKDRLNMQASSLS